jgi:cytoskeleton protein RodZ
MTVIGETLRRERLRRNLELDEISRELKISSKFLEAIEDERFDELPRGVFAKSFVRQYARLLGLDEEELASEVQRAVDPQPSGPQFAERASQPTPSEIHVPRVEAWETVSDNRRFSRSSSLPALALVVVAMLVCSGVYALWQRSRRPAATREDVPFPAQTAQAHPPGLPQTEPAVQPPVSPETAQPQSSRVPTPAQNTGDRPAGDGAAPGTPDAKAGTSTALAGGAATSPVASPATTPPPESVTRVQLPASNPNAPVRVAVTAEELVWVSASTDGKYSFSGTLTANQTRTFEATDTVKLRLGNAGGVTIKLNGQPVGAVGPKGQVRTVQFTSGGFQIVVAPKPSLPLEDLL